MLEQKASLLATGANDCFEGLTRIVWEANGVFGGLTRIVWEADGGFGGLHGSRGKHSPNHVSLYVALLNVRYVLGSRD